MPDDRIITTIADLVDRSKCLSEIRWLAYSGNPHPQTILDVNTALQCAEREEQRWNLFLSLLPLWTTERNNELATHIFGAITQWRYNEPIVLTPIWREGGGGRHRIALYCGQGSVCEIFASPELLKRYHQELTEGGLTITIAELNQRKAVY